MSGERNVCLKRSAKISSTLFALLFSSLIAHPSYAATAEAAAANPQYLFQLSYAEAEEAIGKALVQQGAGPRLSVSINGDSDKPLFSYSKPIHVEIRGLRYEKPARWSANLLFMAEDDDVISAMPVAGHFQEMVQVPVLKHEVRNGDVIGEADIEMHDFPVTRVRTDTITDIAQLAGKTPMFSISPERPVRLHEIASPAVVKKNAIVTMRYTSPGMEITATGQALQEGAKGDAVDVRNTVSRKIVHAVVASANTVEVIAAGAPYASN